MVWLLVQIALVTAESSNSGSAPEARAISLLACASRRPRRRNRGRRRRPHEKIARRRVRGAASARARGACIKVTLKYWARRRRGPLHTRFLANLYGASAGLPAAGMTAGYPSCACWLGVLACTQFLSVAASPDGSVSPCSECESVEAKALWWPKTGKFIHVCVN